MTESGRGDSSERSWWEKPDSDDRATSAPGDEDAHDPYRTSTPTETSSASAPTEAHPVQGPPNEGLHRQYPQQPGREQAYGAQSPGGGAPGEGRGQQPWGAGRNGQNQLFGQQAPQQYGPGQYGPGQYGPGQYGPGQYGQSQYGQGQYGDPRPVAGSAQAVMWTGIGSLVLMGTGLGWIAAIVALVLARGARRTVLSSEGQLRGLGFIRAGKICAWVALALFVLLLLGVLAYVLFLRSVGAFGSSGMFDTADPVSFR